ncbi:hypothetical protein T265_05465 [Opisthorchis viverrini]|uniref:Uncharacterized protein n=1 Tax=Opisthorchis viverrini TaxID=6198 RepID=A0A074ZVV7_OPIVI|nr:hypothetical protein T265_05465 [Opisthorchis viverrini]KER27505.1 hypothetical protein T265_05465 [Opisthorchis viverrini]
MDAPGRQSFSTHPYAFCHLHNCFLFAYEEPQKRAFVQLRTVQIVVVLRLSALNSLAITSFGFFGGEERSVWDARRCGIHFVLELH